MGNFAGSRQEFDFILRAVPLVVGETRAEGNELKEVSGARGEQENKTGSYSTYFLAEAREVARPLNSLEFLYSTAGVSF